MKGKFFLDTNILVYSFYKPDSHKRLISGKLIKEAHLGNGCISYQVVQEFLNVATQKFSSPMSGDEAQKYLAKILFPLCEIFPSEGLYHIALDIKERWKLSFYDSLIIAAALESSSKVLYSEDLQHGQKIYELTIVNPYI